MPVAKTRLETLQICKLLQCVREEDREQIGKLTLNGVPDLINYNEPDNGETPLTIAAAANNDSMIGFLLELGAHPDVVDLKGRTPAMRAAEYGHVQCMDRLAKAGADMKASDLAGKGTIFYCINSTQRHEKCLEIALAHGAEVNNVSKDGIPSFVSACETAKENEEMCLMLLKKGADPNSKSKKLNRTALMAACASGSARVVRVILEKGADVINEIQLRPKVHAAHEAARAGSLECLKILSAYDARFDQLDEQGNTPIHYAAKAGHAMCCKFLGQRGCNPKPKNADGMVARLLAKEEGHKEATKECRKVEKTFGKIGKNNEPWAIALYDFCFEKHDQLLDTYTKFDGDGTGTVSKEDFSDGLSNIGAPLPDMNEMKRIMSLHDKNHDHTVDYTDFLTGKKYVNKFYLMSAFEAKKKKKKGGGKKKKGKTKIAMPICTQPDGMRAEDGGPPEAYIARHTHFTDNGRFDRDGPPKHPLEDDSAWYLQHPGKVYMSLNDAAKHGDLDSLKDAFSHGTAVDTTDKYYKTPLMVAAANGNFDMVKYLVDLGANVNAKDNFSWTPMHHASHAGLLDIVEYLVEHGSLMEAVTMNGATPLMRAIESSRPDVVQFFIDKGAKVQIENKKGQTPVDIAVAYGDARVYDIVKTKWDSLPPPSDKKKKGKAAPKKPGKRPKSSTDGKPQGGTGRDSPGQENVPPARQRKGSILRAASALAGGIEEEENITYTPLKVWTKQPTTQELICEREVRRDRFGWEVDFPDFKMPFLKNVANRVEAEGGLDDD